MFAPFDDSFLSKRRSDDLISDDNIEDIRDKLEFQSLILNDLMNRAIMNNSVTIYKGFCIERRYDYEI